MVFLIQKSQNKDSKAIHLKLNELLASHEGSSNRMVGLEELSEGELDQLRKFYAELSRLAVKEDDITCTHSIDAAEENHQIKQGHYQKRLSYATARSGQPTEKDVPTTTKIKKNTSSRVQKH